MHLHLLGICGTFMGSLAQLAQARGHRVTGCDQNPYPPMSDQLQAAGIDLIPGYTADQLALKPDLWLIGNALSRGNPLIEAILNAAQPYASGPEFLNQQILPARQVLAVAGTHGKTSTASMLAQILDHAGHAPGFLIGGVPANFGTSARLGSGPPFVIEADEYDTAFFDKRSKFLHYPPHTLILNNLEFDHADIFPDLAAIERQFQHLLRLVPSNGQILLNGVDPNLPRVLQAGCWSPAQTFGTEPQHDWQIAKDGQIHRAARPQGILRWNQLGHHNRLNALAAIAAAHSVGVPVPAALAALADFRGVKRRMELLGTGGTAPARWHLYDDFAHHPTAIAATLAGLRSQIGPHERIIAIIEPASNSMKMGIHGTALLDAANAADQVYWHPPAGLQWDLQTPATKRGQQVEADFARLLDHLTTEAQTGGHLVIMSNGGFNGIGQKLLARLSTTA
ncbi:MAG: UDP-N-acetylmuramate:L-alanyl-gamma-D-glutamyl-meso-diaminopimelate ligase [Cellvibrionales bacterium]|nr:UDP-N-acetylmuramate:L-alanyl-gamma-D-glutamyl-meso-diaminopimelate ligase [Cellvibrionales bacterium]